MHVIRKCRTGTRLLCSIMWWKKCCQMIRHWAQTKEKRWEEFGWQRTSWCCLAATDCALLVIATRGLWFWELLTLKTHNFLQPLRLRDALNQFANFFVACFFHPPRCVSGKLRFLFITIGIFNLTLSFDFGHGSHDNPCSRLFALQSTQVLKGRPRCNLAF